MQLSVTTNVIIAHLLAGQSDNAKNQNPIVCLKNSQLYSMDEATYAVYMLPQKQKMCFCVNKALKKRGFNQQKYLNASIIVSLWLMSSHRNNARDNKIHSLGATLGVLA